MENRVALTAEKSRESLSSTAAHTSGPWTVTGSYSEVVKAGDFHYCANFSGIAKTHELQANARLIAAAPDMYASAQPIAACVEGFSGPDSEYISVTAGELRALAAALAKATGAA